MNFMVQNYVCPDFQAILKNNEKKGRYPHNWL